jgi:hypothetical protein
MSDEDLHQLGLLAICQALHMSRYGTSDPLPDDVRERYELHLRRRVAKWKPSLTKSDSYDAIVKALCEAAIDDAVSEAKALAEFRARKAMTHDERKAGR